MEVAQEADTLPLEILEFDLDSILEYVSATSRTKAKEKPKQPPASEGSFTIVSRNWVSQMKAPLPLDSSILEQYLGEGLSMSNRESFIFETEVFELKSSRAEEPILVLSSKQRGNLKKALLMSAHILDPVLQDVMIAEVRFITSRINKCRDHFTVSKLSWALELVPATSSIISRISYQLDIKPSFYRYFSSDVSQDLMKILRPNLAPCQSDGNPLASSYEGLPISTHIFHKIITDKTSLLPNASQSFSHPYLQTELLPFQARSVSWLLEKEGVCYDSVKRQSVNVPIVNEQLYKALELDADSSIQYTDREISEALSKLCYGWKKVLFQKRVCWINEFTGNIMPRTDIIAFLREYHDQHKHQPTPGCGLLSEEMGLGKTVEITCLALLNQRSPSEIGKEISVRLKDEGDFRYIKKAKTTLIAAPETILRQWYAEICQLCPSLSVTIYKGLGKYPELHNIPMYISEYLQSYDIVLLNYATLSKETDYAQYSSSHKPTRGGQKRIRQEPDIDADETKTATLDSSSSSSITDAFKAEFKFTSPNGQIDSTLSQKKYDRAVMNRLIDKVQRHDLRSIPHTQFYESPLMSCQWWRVVLDEVQMVSSGSTRAFATASLIPRFHSWGVSGTPSRSPAVLQFLRYSPFDYDIWKHCWKMLCGSGNINSDFVNVWSSLAVRHTKSMVHNDIQLPPQNRVLLTIPLTEVEQDKYNEVLDSTLAYIGVYDDNIDLVSKKTMDSASYSHLRNRLVKLRQLCGNLQVGRLPKAHSTRGKHKTKFLISGVKELKTLETVLTDMIQSVTVDVGESEKTLFNRALEICQALEYFFYPEKVVEILKIVLTQVQAMMVKLIPKSERDFQQYKQVRETLQKHDVLPKADIEELSNINNDVVTKEEEMNEVTETENGTSQVKKDPNLDIESLLDQYHHLKELVSSNNIRVRSWRMAEHKCYFLLASAHFQLHDTEYQEKIQRLRVAFVALNDLTSTLSSCGITSDSKLKVLEIKVESGEHVESTLATSNDSTDDGHKLLETHYYEEAEKCRKEILKHSIAEVETVTLRRIKNRNWIQAGDWINNGTKLFPKSSKKLFLAMPRIDLIELSELVGNVKTKQIYDQYSHLVTKLNAQSEVINDNVSKLRELLSNPVTTDEKDVDGEEYEKSVEDQDHASCLMLVTTQMLMDRANVTVETGNAIIEVKKQQEYEFKLEVQRVSDKKFLKDLQSARLKVKIDVNLSFEEIIQDCRFLEIEMKDDRNGAQLEIYQDLFNGMKNIFENEKTAQSLLKKELNTSFNAVFNARVEYFKQLQQISDSVQNKSLKMSQENIDTDTLNVMFRNMYRNLTLAKNKLTRSVSRLKYLNSLIPDTGDTKNEEESICIICQSAITVGSLTSCGHKFCKTCLEVWLERQFTCPLCKTYTSKDTIYGFTQYKADLKIQKIDNGHAHSKGSDYESKSSISSIYKQLDEGTLKKVQRIKLENSYGSKVDLIVKQVLYLQSLDPEVQIVIFSQWQDLLVILAFAFEKTNISYVSVRGSHLSSYKKKHSDPVQEFKDVNNLKTCFLLDSQAQASGLTLTNATHIFLCEPLINTSTELQAISRIHRIGQRRLTTVWMFAIENSIEEKIVSLGTKRRIEYFHANAQESRSTTSKQAQQITEDSNLGENELIEAESFALTLDTSASKKKISGITEFVSDEDLFEIYFQKQATINN